LFPPLLKVPPASRGEPSGARVRFPLLAGGTSRRGFGTHPPASRGEPRIGVQGEPAGADKGTSLGFAVGRVRPLSALTPSPSPTAWERGAARGHVWSAEALASAWAEASLPHSIIPLSRPAGEGDTGVRATRSACLFTLALGKTAPASKTSYRTVVPLSDLQEGVGFKIHISVFVELRFSVINHFETVWFHRVRAWC
jgi:hypothetical protein